MKIRKSILAFAVAASALPAAFANNFVGGEIGFESHPVTSSLTREQVRAELNAFRAHPVLADGSVWVGGEAGTVSAAEGAFADRVPAAPHTHVVGNSGAAPGIVRGGAGEHTSEHAFDLASGEKAIPLNDGSTVYIFKDGKMAMENKWGRAEFMNPGHVMKTPDGKTIIMVGNEVARLHRLLTEAHGASGG